MFYLFIADTARGGIASFSDRMLIYTSKEEEVRQWIFNI